MAISDTARRILTAAAQHPLRLAAPPNKLPIAACQAVLSNLLKQGYAEECAAPDEFAGLRWHQQDGSKPTVRITEAGMAAIGATPVATATLPDTESTGTGMVPADTAQEPGSTSLAAPVAPVAPMPPIAADAAQAPSTRPSLRDAALAVGGDSIEQADSARRQDGRFRLTSAQKLRVPTNQTKVHSKA